MNTLKKTAVFAAAAASMASGLSEASSHREAPFITTAPKVDGTDFYMFRSYETGRDDMVTLIANYLPLQDAYGGPNYFSLDPNALYEIHIDNSGDGVEDITFQFRFNTEVKGLSLPIGEAGAENNVAVPLANIGAITAMDSSAQNVVETYTVNVVRGDRRTGSSSPVSDDSGNTVFAKPIDNIGNKSIADYPAYAANFVHDVQIPGCGGDARIFVGQRREGFVVNLGETFDLVNIAVPVEELGPAGQDARDLEANIIADKNVTSLALEIPSACLTNGSDPVIGGWTTASLRQARVLNPEPQRTDGNSAIANPTGAEVAGGAWTQVSRLGSPLVNEVVIGLPDKDLFNASEPANDAANFAPYVLTPSLPELLEILFGSAGVKAPDVFPRTDLIWVFLNGIPDVTRPASGTDTVLSEMLRLNTAIAPTPMGDQSDLGVLGGDNAGFPNGRRPVDDVVDIALRAAMGVLIPQDQDPASAASRQLSYTDGARPNPMDYKAGFPYLADPIPGSPNEVAGR